MSDSVLVTTDIWRALVRGTIVLALAGAALLACLHLTWRHEPFDASLGAQISAGYTGVSLRAFEAHGIVPLQAQWSLFVHPEAIETRVAYVNHPALPLLAYWPAYLYLGRDGAALRVGSLVLLAISVGGLFCFLGRTHGLVLGATGLLVVSTTPAVLQYGNLVCPPLFGLPWMVLAAWAWIEYGHRSRAFPLAAYLVLALIAALSDWNTYGLAPALWLDLLGRGRWSKHRMRKAVLISIPFLVGIAVFLVHAVWTLGSLGAVLSKLGEIAGMLYGVSVGAWFARFGGYLVIGFGWPVLLLAGAGAIVAVLRIRKSRDDRLARAAGVLIVAGIVPCAVFWSRAGTHDFWILVVAPGIAALASLSLSAAAKGIASLPRLVQAPLAAAYLVGLTMIAASGVIGGLDLHRRFRTDVLVERAAILDELFAPEDVVLFSDYDATFGARFYARVPVIPKVENLEVWSRVLALLCPARDRIGKLWFAAPGGELHRQAWVLALPRVPGSERVVPFAAGTLTYMELDRDRCLSP